jgi:hypothetical protein
VCSPEYGVRPLRCTKAHRQGCNRERGARGARLGPHRSSSGGVATVRRWEKRRRRKSSATAVLVLREMGKSAMGRCGESRGSHRPFIGAVAHQRGVAGRSNSGVNGFNAIGDGGEVKRGIKGEGNNGGVSNSSGGIRGVELGGARSGGRRWHRDHAQWSWR